MEARSRLFVNIRLEIALESTVGSPRAAAALVAEAARNFVSGGEAQRLQVALQELLQNSLEHGNLEISGPEKASSLSSETFERLLHERAGAARHAGKLIHLEAELSADAFRFRVRDAGSGFSFDAAHSAAGLTLRGRGLTIARDFFDTVEFGAGGAEVSCERRLEPREAGDSRADL